MSPAEDSAMNQDDQGPTDRAAEELPEELQVLEARLAALTPRNDRLNRERLMFLAGQASVASTKEPPRNLLGVPLDARFWPPAFAGMTALAATLLAILISKPALVEPPAMRSGGVANTAQRSESPLHIGDDHTDLRNDVLSTRDSHRQDVERLLAKLEVHSADVDGVEVIPADYRDHPMLTPAAWRRMSSSSESTGPPASDSSSVPTMRGINS